MATAKIKNTGNKKSVVLTDKQEKRFEQLSDFDLADVVFDDNYFPDVCKDIKKIIPGLKGVDDIKKCMTYFPEKNGSDEHKLCWVIVMKDNNFIISCVGINDTYWSFLSEATTINHVIEEINKHSNLEILEAEIWEINTGKKHELKADMTLTVS